MKLSRFFVTALTVAALASTPGARANAGTCGDGTLDIGEACDDGNTSAADCCSADCQAAAFLGFPCTRLNDNPCTVAVCDGNGTCVQDVPLPLFPPTLCPDSDGGNLCTVAVCDGNGACVQDVPAVSCDPTPTQCSTADTCNPATGLCEANDKLAGAPCTNDDGNACTTASCDGAGTCADTALPSCAGPPDLDHFLCYESHRPPLDRSGVSLVDQFGASTVTVKRSKRLCAPADKNGEDPAAITAKGHLTAYTIKQDSPRFRGESNVTVANQFGEIVVDLYRAERLLVPTAMEDAPPPPGDHFKCYRVRGARVRRQGVTVETQFGEVAVDIKQPRHLCAPANKLNESPDAETHPLHLMCYQARAAARHPVQVFTKNQFGADQYDIFGVRELCVPSFKNPGICGDGSINAPGEICDPPDAVCAPDGRLCASDCTCPAPYCGDSIVTAPGEQCEVGNDAACPGRCLPPGDPNGCQCTVCGDGRCEFNEEDLGDYCAADCCDNGRCETSEAYIFYCAADCCGDGICEFREAARCPTDCPS